MALLENDPLENFNCQVGTRYPVSQEWCFSVDHPRARLVPRARLLDVRKALDNLEAFIRDVRSHPPMLYQHEPQVDVVDLQEPLEQGPAVVEGAFTLHHGGNESEYKYAGPRNILNCEGKLSSDYERVIFTPSKGRCNVALLRWSSEENLVDTLGVVVVPLNELREYSDRWGANRLIISVDHECVGEVRYHIIQLTRHWGLETFWMMDDSVPTSNLYRKTWGYQEGDPILRFDRVLKTIESMPSLNRFSNAALIGLTSTFSIQTLGKSANRYAINKRTPTSCVFVCLRNIPEELNYERQLPSKEDVIFAAQLIVAGRDVIIDRYIHFADYPFTVGGCTHNPFANNGTLAKELLLLLLFLLLLLLCTNINTLRKYIRP